MPVDVRNKEHLDKVEAYRLALQVDVGSLRAREQMVAEGLPPRFMAGDVTPRPRPQILSWRSQAAATLAK